MGIATLRRAAGVAPSKAPSVAGGKIARAEHNRIVTEISLKYERQILELRKKAGLVDEAPAPSPEPAAEAPAEHPSQAMNASEAIEHLEGLESVADVEAMKVAEASGKGRKGVLKAIDEHLALLAEE